MDGPFGNGCRANSRFGNIHECRIEGTPHSAMTYYRCDHCGERWERGPGSFHGMPRYEPPRLATIDDVHRIVREESLK